LDVFGSCDLDLDPMSFIYELDPYCTCTQYTPWLRLWEMTCKGKKVNVDLYSALSWTHLKGAQVWHAFSRNLTVLPAHPAYIRNGM